MFLALNKVQPHLQKKKKNPNKRAFHVLYLLLHPSAKPQHLLTVQTHSERQAAHHVVVDENMLLILGPNDRLFTSFNHFPVPRVLNIVLLQHCQQCHIQQNPNSKVSSSIWQACWLPLHPLTLFMFNKNQLLSPHLHKCNKCPFSIFFNLCNNAVDMVQVSFSALLFALLVSTLKAKHGNQVGPKSNFFFVLDERDIPGVIITFKSHSLGALLKLVPDEIQTEETFSKFPQLQSLSSVDDSIYEKI